TTPNHPLAKNHTHPPTPPPKNSEKGHSSRRNSDETFIERHHPSAWPVRSWRDRSRRESPPRAVAPSRPSLSSAVDRGTTQSRPPRHLRGSLLARRRPPQQNARQFPQSFPSTGQTRGSYRRPPVRGYCDRRQKRASLRQRRRRPVHKARPAHQYCQAGERLRRRGWWSDRTTEWRAAVPALGLAIATAG